MILYECFAGPRIAARTPSTGNMNTPASTRITHATCVTHVTSLLLVSVGLALPTLGIGAETNVQIATASQLKRLTLEQLMNVDVTSVSRQAEPWFTSPSAIQVITQE